MSSVLVPVRNRGDLGLLEIATAQRARCPPLPGVTLGGS
jgi:hypothetical protein